MLMFNNATENVVMSRPHRQPGKPHIFQPTQEQQSIIASVNQIDVINAGPGSGKTSTLIAIAGAPKYQGQTILALTHSARAEVTLRKRAKKAGIRHIQVATIHGFGYELITTNPAAFGYSKTPRPTDVKSVKALIKRKFRRAFKGTPLDDETERELFTVLKRSILRGTCIQADLDTLDFNRRMHAPTLQALQAQIVKSQQNHCRLAFSDMLHRPVEYFKNTPQALRNIGKRYHVLLVDEFQDLSSIQLKLIELLATVIDKVVVVGDDAQTIYGFHGAQTGTLWNFAEKHQVQPRALSQSHRSTQEILDLANVVRRRLNVTPLTMTSTVHGKKPELILCPTKETQAQEVGQLLNRLTRTVKACQIAVLAREKLSLRDLHKSLESKGIKTVLGSEETLKHICDGLEAFLRVFARGKKAPMEAVDTVLHICGLTPHSRNQDAIRHLKASKKKHLYLIKKLKAAQQARSIEAQLSLIQDVLVHYQHQDRHLIVPVITQLMPMVRGQTCKQAIQEIQRYRSEHMNSVALQTIHSAKGLEYEVVIVIDMVDGHFPHCWAHSVAAQEEERRLLYVAITRAKRELFLLSPPYQSYNPKTRQPLTLTQRCPFLEAEFEQQCVKKTV
ncbi:UvrD-helicase domain-containing protein [Allochromatium humboldtianum]|uniref:DNA 3'-5' helicase n=1 Tax=Allochromatium humboldtianum TaxID=504901 RepID=A0A850R903_9GAMM|nr:ATP-dependent helicase [Allochromatium humboldtianum]NVZ09778.1 UvrD-helicase domain-containing protein [Allochromatium humboldtianum]